jgi:hypothetical protein
MFFPGELEQTLLVALDASGSWPFSTFDLARDAYRYPPDTDLRGMGLSEINTVRRTLRRLERGRLVRAVPWGPAPPRGRQSWLAERWAITSLGTREMRRYAQFNRAPEATAPAPPP